MVKHRRATPERRDAARVWAAFAIAAGFAIVLWALFVVRDQAPPQAPPVTPSTSSSAQTPSPSQSPAQSPTGVPELYPVRPQFGSRFGTITLPKLDLSWPIYEGTTAALLAKGVGHYVGSVLPGLQDNTVLSGHRTTVFNRLGELNKGDLAYVETSAGIFTYVVRSFRIVKRTDKTVIVPTETAVLTLTTCYPFDNIGATTDAFVVTADLVSSQF